MAKRIRKAPAPADPPIPLSPKQQAIAKQDADTCTQIFDTWEAEDTHQAAVHYGTAKPTQAEQQIAEVQHAYNLGRAEAQGRLDGERVRDSALTATPKNYRGRKKAARRYLDRYPNATDVEVCRAMDDEGIEWKVDRAWVDAIAGTHGKKEAHLVHVLISEVRHNR